MGLSALTLLVAVIGFANCQFGGLPGGQLLSGATNAGSKLTSSVLPKGVIDSSFNSFEKTFQKTYETPQIAQLRKGIFADNLNKIENFNKEFQSGAKSFQLGVNQFVDLALNEFNKIYNGFGKTLKKPILSVVPSLFKSSDAPKPDHVDWREKGAVSPVKLQGECASCYAFAVAGALESQIFLKTGKLVDLSPQNIVDCSRVEPHNNNGCNGGFTDASIDYVKTTGLDPEGSYPYEGNATSCRFNKDAASTKTTGIGRIVQGDEKALEEAVATIGPIIAAIDANHETFQAYKSGIYNEPTCKSNVDDLNHSVLVVGYGKDAKTGKKYWIVKNSFGPQWGEEGYIRIAKDQKNHCGIATWAVYPKI